MMAAVAIGAYSDMESCVSEWVTPLLGDAETPEPDLQAIYSELYPAYAKAREALEPVWDRLAAHRDGADAKDDASNPTQGGS